MHSTTLSSCFEIHHYLPQRQIASFMLEALTGSLSFVSYFEERCLAIGFDPFPSVDSVGSDGSNENEILFQSSPRHRESLRT